MIFVRRRRQWDQRPSRSRTDEPLPRHCEERLRRSNPDSVPPTLDCFVASLLAMTKEAERRQALFNNLRALRARRARSVARSPVGVPPRHLRRRANAPAQLQNALPGTWSERTTPMVRKIMRIFAGVTRAFLSQSSDVVADRSSCRPGVYPEPPGSGGDEPPPAGTAPAPPAGVTGCRPFGERDSAYVAEAGTIVKRCLVIRDAVKGRHTRA